MEENAFVKPLLHHGGAKVGKNSSECRESSFRRGRCDGNCKVEAEQPVDFTEC